MSRCTVSFISFLISLSTISLTQRSDILFVVFTLHEVLAFSTGEVWGIGFDLRTFPPHDRARFDRSVNQGLRAMPAWGGTLKPGQLDQLWAYLGSVNGWPADGAAPSGAAAASSPP